MDKEKAIKRRVKFAQKLIAELNKAKVDKKEQRKIFSRAWDIVDTKLKE